MEHFQFFKAASELYFKVGAEKRPIIMKKLVMYGNFQEMIQSLSKLWFSSGKSLQDPSKCLEFFMKYVLTGRKVIDFGHLKEVSEFYFKLLELRAQPPSFPVYTKFLSVFMNVLKNYEHQKLFDRMIQLPYESALYPLVYFGTVAPEFNLKVCQILVDLSDVAFKAPVSRIAWVEGFAYYISHKPDSQVSKAKMQEIIEGLLGRAEISTELKVKLLYYSGAYFNKEVMLKMFDKFFVSMLKLLTHATAGEGMTYIFSIAILYYTISENKQQVLDNVFKYAMPYFYDTPQIAVEATKFAKALKPEELKQGIAKLIESDQCIRARMFFVSRFPTPETVGVLFKSVSHEYRSSQYQAMMYFMEEHEVPEEYLAFLFTLLKVNDFNYLHKILQERPDVYCRAMLKYLQVCYETDKLTSILDQLLEKKVLPVVDVPLENVFLTTAVHYFGLRRMHDRIGSLLDYVVACHAKKTEEFDFEAAVNRGDRRWPNGVHDSLEGQKAWVEELCQFSLKRLEKQENQQCLALVAINADGTLLHNCALLLLKDEKLLTLLFCAAVTNDTRTALVELRRLLSDYTVGPAQKTGFFDALLKLQPFQPASIQITPTVLNVLSQVATCLPFSQLLVDVLITAFPSDQPSSYLPASYRAVEAVCGRAEGREIIHHIIDRVCMKNKSADVNGFVSALTCALNHNQSLNEEIALKVAELFASLVAQQRVPKKCGFEAAFCDPNYGEVPCNLYVKQLEAHILKDEKNESLFRSLKRVMKAKNDPVYFQKFYTIFISNSLSKTSFIRRFCLNSLDKIDNIGFSWPSRDELMAMSPCDILATVGSFFDKLASKFSFETSLILNELLSERFEYTLPGNQVAIALFYHSIIKRFTKEYLVSSKQFLPQYFKDIRKTQLEEHCNLRLTYTKTLVVLCNCDATRFMVYAIESCTKDNFPRDVLRTLFNIPQFLKALFDYISGLLKLRKDDLVVEHIARCAHLLCRFVIERLNDEWRDQCLMATFVLLTVTYVTFSKWTEFFRQPHIEEMRRTIKHLLGISSAEARALPLVTLNTQHNLSAVLEAIVHKLDYKVNPAVLSEYVGTDYEFMKYYIITMLYEHDGTLHKELIRSFDNEEFVQTYLPRILVEISSIFDHRRLRNCDENVVNGLIVAVFRAFEAISVADIEVCFGLFLRLLLAAKDEFILTHLKKILVSMNNVILVEPNLITIPEFSNVLFRIIDLKPDPLIFVADFDAINLKMAAAILSDSQDARDCADLFFKKLFDPKASTLDYDGIFASLASLYTAYDKSPMRYIEMATSIVRVVGKWKKVNLEQIRVLGQIVRPLILLNDARCREEALIFVAELEKFAMTCDASVLETVLNLISEFASPEIMKIAK